MVRRILLEEIGASVDFVPLLRFRYLQENLVCALEHQFDVLVVSSSRVVDVLEMIEDKHLRIPLYEKQWLIVGQKTTQRVCKLAEKDGVCINNVITADTAKELVVIMRNSVDFGSGALFLAGNKSLACIPDALSDMDVWFKKAVVYDTILDGDSAVSLHSLLERGEKESTWVCFFSPSGVEAVQSSPVVVEMIKQCNIMAYGPTTAKQVEKVFSISPVVPVRPTASSLRDLFTSNM